MEFEKVIRERMAIRKYTGEPVPKEVLIKILDAGRLAPTAKNIQPFKIYVVESKEGLEKIDKASPCRYGAGTVLMILGDTNQAFSKGAFTTAEMDSCIVATHLMLEATNQGVDNIWIEYFDEEILRKEFNLPEHLRPICLLPMGYRSDDCPLNAAHDVRKELREIVEYK